MDQERLSDNLNSVRRMLAASIPATDSATWRELGVAFLEMELFDDALDAFEKADDTFLCAVTLLRSGRENAAYQRVGENGELVAALDQTRERDRARVSATNANDRCPVCGERRSQHSRCWRCLRRLPPFQETRSPSNASANELVALLQEWAGTASLGVFAFGSLLNEDLFDADSDLDLLFIVEPTSVDLARAKEQRERLRALLSARNEDSRRVSIVTSTVEMIVYDAHQYRRFFVDTAFLPISQGLAKVRPPFPEPSEVPRPLRFLTFAMQRAAHFWKMFVNDVLPRQVDWKDVLRCAAVMHAAVNGSERLDVYDLRRGAIWLMQRFPQDEQIARMVTGRGGATVRHDWALGLYCEMVTEAQLLLPSTRSRS